MGFEIKAHIECRINDQWHHYSCPNILRNYELFDFLGADFSDRGIKPDSEKFLSVGIIPSDSSLVTITAFKKDYDDLFNPSWLNVHELNKVIEKFPELSSFNYDLPPELRNPLGYFFDNSVESFWKYREDYPEEIQDVRMVFWFK